MDEFVTVIVSSVIAGGFGLLGKYLEVNYEKNFTKAQQAVGDGKGGRDIAAPFNYGVALKQVGLLQLSINLISIPVAFLMAVFTTNITSIIYMIAFVGTVILAAAFYWIGKSMGPAIPWKHMSVVAIGTAIVTYTINLIFLQMPFEIGQFAMAFIQPFVGMGLGVGILHLQRLSSPAPSSSPSQTPAPQELPAAFGGGGSSSTPHLFGRSGEMSTKMVPIDRQELVIGRGTESHLRLKDPSVSRTHAKILTSQKGIYIRDEKSRIGTFVNGHRISRGTHVLLKHGDMIGIGDKYIVEFRSDS